jgi:hypothetical protein
VLPGAVVTSKTPVVGEEERQRSETWRSADRGDVVEGDVFVVGTRVVVDALRDAEPVLPGE